MGYSSVEKRDITGSVSSVKASAFKDISLNGIDQALQGQAAGVQVTQSSGTPGGGISVRIRGVTSISAGNRPLFIVDGIPVETGALSGRSYGGQTDNALSLINPNDIESIEVLKDASTQAAYGSRASNGVVVIRTKRGKDGKTKITLFNGA
jgi:TonB-dependent starch-binding outer membrane protein SusC